VFYQEFSIVGSDGWMLNSVLNMPKNNNGVRPHRNAPQFVGRTIAVYASTIVSSSPLIVDIFEEADLELNLRSPKGRPGPELVPPPRQRTVSCLGRHTVLDPALFLNVTMLYVTEMLFDPNATGRALPPLPKVQRLVIYTMRPLSHIESPRWVSTFVCPSPPDGASSTVKDSESGDSDDEYSVTAPHHTLICPSLQTIVIGARRPYEPDSFYPLTRFEPETIVRFVQGHLRYDIERLRRIELVGLDLHVIDPRGLQQLLELADEVDWDSRELVDRFQLPVVMGW
jgi:hypothetical protein